MQFYVFHNKCWIKSNKTADKAYGVKWEFIKLDGRLLISMLKSGLYLHEIRVEMIPWKWKESNNDSLSSDHIRPFEGKEVPKRIQIQISED